MHTLNRPSVNVQSGDVAFPAVQAELVASSGNAVAVVERDEGEEPSGDSTSRAWGLTGAGKSEMEADSQRGCVVGGTSVGHRRALRGRCAQAESW